MTILKILQYPDSRLKQKAIDVTDIKSEAIQKIIDDMLETLAQTANCAGLSATQLDIKNPPNITVINSLNGTEPPQCLVNLKIATTEGESTEEEGCMSVYPCELSALVTRAENVKATALDRNGNAIEINASGFFARVIQHEFDHLNGTLYIDRLSKLKRTRIEKKIAKMQCSN